MRVHPMRRFAALALALALAFVTTVEIQIADVHDGHSELTSLAPAAADSDGETAPPGPASSHTAHVDHCTHAHVASPPDGANAGLLLNRGAGKWWASSSLVHSETVAPPVPPPVA